MLSKLADDAGLHAVGLFNPPAPRLMSYSSTWVMISRSDARIHALARSAEQRARARGMRTLRRPVTWPTPGMIAGAPLWTDDYSNLFQVLK